MTAAQILPFPTTNSSNPDLQRALSDEDAALRAGFSLRPPVYAIGTSVNELGVKNFRGSRAAFEALPTAREACADLASAVEAERRHDITVDIPGLRMLDNGKLCSDAGVLPLSERAFEGLCRFVVPAGARYLAECEPRLRAHNLNHWFGRAFRTERDTSRRLPRKLVLRMRETKRGEEIFGVVGPRYSAFDVDELATRLHAIVPGDARGEVIYDGYRAKLSLLYHSDIVAEHCVAGEIFKAGVVVTTADDGTGAVKVSAVVWRNLCRNLLILDVAKQLVTSRRHIGNGIGDAVRDGVDAAMAKIGHFADKWTEATLDNVLERYGFGDMPTLLRALVTSELVQVSGVSDNDLTDRLVSAWYEEPGYSKAAVINAITRVAHTDEWPSWTTGEDLERTAGELLYARVWQVQRPEAAV